MKIDYQELFPNELSDETAYHLIQFFFNFALLFEGMHLGQALRYESSLINRNNPRDITWEEEDSSNPPF